MILHVYMGVILIMVIVGQLGKALVGAGNVRTVKRYSIFCLDLFFNLNVLGLWQ